ncbi:MAG: hypothetical protein SNJ55_02230 [Chloroherpetonaceae bacterium]
MANDVIEWISSLPEELRTQMIAATVVVVFYVVWFIKFYASSLNFGIEKIQQWFKVDVRYDQVSGYDVFKAPSFIILILTYLSLFLWLIVATLAPAVVAYSVLAFFFGV